MDSILVISEEAALAETLASELPGFTVEPAGFREALKAAGENRHGLIIVDEDGATNDMPDAGKTSVIRLTRPVRLSELLYTIRERLQGKSAQGREELVLSYEFRLFPFERLVRSLDAMIQVQLTEKETLLLQSLLEAAGAPVARDVLLKKVWGYNEEITTHTLETHVYRLRGKLRQASESLDILSSEEGGYLLKG